VIYLYYILEGTKVKKVKKVEDWGKWYEKANKDGSRIVKQQQVGPYYISTVFLGMDHNLEDRGRPIVFESMVFTEHTDSQLGNEVECVRYENYGQALRGHKKLAKRYRDEQS
jgi:hypothetical protein